MTVLMGPIVCAMRGGEVSRRTQERAIALARERETPLIFFFVADTGFAGRTSEPLSEALDDELARLGRTMLYIARARAREQGISAHAVVRHGTVSEVMEDFLREVDASLLVMGTPQENSGHQSFKPGEISEFAERVHAATGVEVLVIS